VSLYEGVILTLSLSKGRSASRRICGSPLPLFLPLLLLLACHSEPQAKNPRISPVTPQKPNRTA
jgi:hypothetical protein